MVFASSGKSSVTSGIGKFDHFAAALSEAVLWLKSPPIINGAPSGAPTELNSSFNKAKQEGNLPVGGVGICTEAT